jgi:hypothetical protein
MGQPEDYIIEDETQTINKPTITIQLEEDQENCIDKDKRCWWVVAAGLGYYFGIDTMD